MTQQRVQAASLCELLDPDTLADPYPLYRRLREAAPVTWDPYLHAWVVTGYPEIVTVLHKFSANRAFSPEQFKAIGMGDLEPIGAVMARQMLFMDPPDHTKLRGLCAAAFAPRRVERLRAHIQTIADTLIDRVVATGRMEVIADFAAPLPAIVTAKMLGVPASDHEQLKAWSADFAEMLGNFQHNPGRTEKVAASLIQLSAYLHATIQDQRRRPAEGLIADLLGATIDGVSLSEDEVVANTIVTMVGGQETTTNLIGNGLLTLLRNPVRLAELRDQPEFLPSAIEELLRYESPSQHTARLAPDDVLLGGKHLRKRDAVIAVMAAGNRDPARFPDPDRLDLRRTDNRHLAFGWAAHFCFGAPLARLEGVIAFETLLRRLPDLALLTAKPIWRENLGLRGLVGLDVAFTPTLSRGARS